MRVVSRRDFVIIEIKLSCNKYDMSVAVLERTQYCRLGHKAKVLGHGGLLIHPSSLAVASL
jgi:hypothetical protein